MELEDTVTLLTGVLRTMNNMLGTMNEIVSTHTELLLGQGGSGDA